MKAILTSDWHITSKTPRGRKDGLEYVNNQFNKIKFIVDLAVKSKAIILHAGDMFDIPSIPFSLFLRYVMLFVNSEVPIYVVYGQHDMKYRQREDSPLNLLIKLKIVSLLGNNSLSDYRYKPDNFGVYGASFEEEIPKPKYLYSILVTHRMVITNKLWPSQTDYVEAKKINEWAKGYWFILSGDNHQTFTITNKGNTLFNPGSLMRSRVDQTDHEPVIGFLNGFSFETVKIPVLPSKDILYQNEKEERNIGIRFDNLLSHFADKTEGKRQIKFVQFLRDILKKKKIRKEVGEFIEGVIANVK